VDLVDQLSVGSGPFARLIDGGLQKPTPSQEKHVTEKARNMMALCGPLLVSSTGDAG